MKWVRWRLALLAGSVLLILFVTVLPTLAIGLGDKFLEEDRLAYARLLYQSVKMVRPNNADLDQRLLAVETISTERRVHSEETDFEELAYIKKEDKYILGASVTIPVLMYHYIRINPDPNDKVGFGLSVTPINFAAQMQYLADHGYHPIDLNDLGAALFSDSSLPDKPVVITLDDGYRDAYTAAFPVLKNLGFKAVDFIITGLVGAPVYLTWNQIAEMDKSGVFSFGAHTVHHLALTYLSPARVSQELLQSKADLERHLGYNVDWLAYPYGNVNMAVAKEAEEAAFAGAFGTNNGTYHSRDAMFTLPRVRVGGGESLVAFANSLPWK